MRHPLRLAALLGMVAPLVALATIHPARAAGPTGAEEQASRLEIVSATVDDPAGFAALFGAGADRTLRLAVRNTSPVPIRAVATARWGKGSSATTPIRSSPVVVVRSSQTAWIDMPFRVDAMTMGELTVEGEVRSRTETAAFSAQTSQWPWGLAIVPIACVALGFLGVRHLLRRRRRPVVPPFEPMGALRPVAKGALLPGDPHGPVPMLVPDVVIDLRDSRVDAEPVAVRQIIDLRDPVSEPAPAGSTDAVTEAATEPDSERALLERVQLLTAQLRESARSEVASLNLSPSEEERRLNQASRTTRELAEALVLASEALGVETARGTSAGHEWADEDPAP